ncbi:Sensor protein ZraS [Symmachiella dynata]|uniref:histidine kinase n=1 Tax=Symmachiella dynata TaxID=2527995 RepID=A0A517ZSH6_9PLAN|nr:ATP-binding protein [Symmachiella dynata]QDU45365.1 Sensor protein ZraS [Symmachiella dynata]
MSHDEALGRTSNDTPRWDLAAETITVRIRWFGLCVGYALVNVLERDIHNHAVMNAILTLGAVYALLDTVWSIRGRVFLSRAPLIVAVMEAVFIGLLCYFDQGAESPFRYYYFLSLLVFALRYSRWLTYSTFTLHSLSFATLVLVNRVPGPDGGMHLVAGSGETLLLMLIFMGWVTWAGTSLGGLLQNAGGRLRQMNDKLTQNQLLLEQRIAERTQELQESQAQLVQQEKHAAFGLLAAGIAHEVGNPLAAISSLVQMLNRRPTDEYTREKLSLVDDQLRRIQRTLRELVDFSRPATTQKSKCDIHEIIDAALNIAKYYKRKKGKKIVTRYAEGIPLLRAARDQLVQILLNLILNAMDATDEGGTIEISTQLKDGTIEVAISDDGHGISAENQQRIFQPYFTTKETGTGLGLFVCRGIIEQAGEGRIELRESSSAGTTFVVYVTCEVVRAHPDVLESEAVRTEMTTP